MTDVKRSWDNLIAELRHISERGSKDADLFLTIRGLFDRIPKLVLYDDSPEPGISLVHYTTWKNAVDMFNTNHKSPVLECITMNSLMIQMKDKSSLQNGRMWRKRQIGLVTF